jgi:Fic family protein
MFVKSWKHIFVCESNMIDPQPGYMGNHLGCHMYDNHLQALNFVLSEGWEMNPSTPLDVHRFLTRGIPFFEDSGNSGKYRTVDVWIGHETCPSPYMLENLMNDWFDFSKKIMRDVESGKIVAFDAALSVHHYFETIHPFIDGNGRTGRLLLQKVLTDLGQDPVIIFFDDRSEYYDAIENFRDSYWDGKTVDYDKLLVDLKMGHMFSDFQL